MAKSTLNLFYSTQLHEEKHFEIDYIDQWLLNFTAVEIKDFQYIKNQLLVNIKINMSQNNLESSAANDIDYISIKNDNESKIYYYFVKNKIWRSQETIEFELKMDTLNTHPFNVDYAVNKRTLVLREHKDRIKLTERNPITSPLSEEDTLILSNFINGSELPAAYSKKFMINSEMGISQNANIYTSASSLSDYPLTIYVYLPDQSLFTSLKANYLTIVDGIITIGVPTNPKPKFSLLDNSIGSVVVEVEYKSGIVGTSAINPWIILNEEFNGFDTTFARLIDKYPENINPALFKKSDELLLDQDGRDNWYLIYANENAPVDNPTDTEAKYVNPVRIMFSRNTPYSISAQVASPKTIYPNNFPKLVNQGEQLGIRYDSIDVGAYIEINGVQYTLSPTLGDGNYNEVRILKQYDNSQVFHTIYLYKETSNHLVQSCDKFSNVGYVVFYGVSNGSIGGWQYFDINYFDNLAIMSQLSNFEIGSNAQVSSYQSSSFDDLDLTLSQLIKVIQLPYAPMEFLSGITEITSFPSELAWNSDFNLLQVLPDKRFNFSWQMIFSSSPFSNLYGYKEITDKAKQERDDNLESKFFNSEFTLPKFVYDQFSFTFQLELIDIDRFLELSDYQNFYVSYGVSKRLSSRMYFQFDQYVCNNYERQDYNNVLLCDRNNEIPLYTNAYINYMRTGFQFDQTNKQNSQVGRWAGIALSAVGAVASFASSAATGGIGIAGGIGLLTSSIAQVVGAITTQNQQENAISQKMLQTALQGENVQTSDDVELFDQYGENKAKLVKYQPSEVMSKLIKDLFYYGGYATNEYKIPNVNTRIYFNYLQCELVVNHTDNIPEPIMEDIILKFKEGATIFHRYEGEWDIEQQYENYEVSI